MSGARPLALVTAALLGILARATPPAQADSVVTETADLSVTPSLGRGYTPAISAFHSVCFDTMPTSKASFDFDYTFEDLELDAAAGVRRREVLDTYEVTDFVERNTQERRVTDGTTTRYFHYLLASLVVDSYYSAIDEAHAAVSKDAVGLLQRGDLVGFFTACGTHYIRSISRRSYFLTLFSYATEDTRRDRTFERKLEQEVRRVDGQVASGQAGAADAEFLDRARTRQLELVTRSIGLTAQRSATLLPFDLASYQDSVKEAFKATQDDLVGRITAMEIYPWLSNTTILGLIGSRGGDAATWNERKRILADNAEFYIELARHLDEMTSAVHRAEACREAVDDETLRDGKRLPEYDGAVVVNRRTGERVPLQVLLDALSDANIDRMRAIGLAIRGGANGAQGAAACMAELERTNLAGTFHNDIPSCHWSRETLPGARIIQEYCMPQIERRTSTTRATTTP